MRSQHSAPRFPTLGGLAMLTGVLALAGRSTAAQAQATPQDGDSVPMEIVFVVFPDTTAAHKAMTSLTPTQQRAVESYQVVSKGKNGTLTGQKKHDKKGNSKQAQEAGQMIDGVYALLNQRPSSSAAKPARDTSVKGYAPGGAAGGGMPVSTTDASKMQGMLQAGQAAVILVVDTPQAKDVEQALSPGAGPDGVVLHIVPLPQ